MLNQETTPKTSTLAALRPPQEDIKNLPSVSIGFGNLQSFELTQRAAKLLASSSLVPKEYQGNVSNCVIALNMAIRIGADPLMVMQNLVIVHGRPTWSSQFLIATVNSCGRFSALRYEFFGEVDTDTWGCRAWAIEKTTGEKLVGTDITIKIAKDEGWYNKNGSKWKTIPQQMLMYRAGSWWTRAYAPELSMGLSTAEEARDFIDAEKMEDGSYVVNIEGLRASEKTDEGSPNASEFDVKIPIIEENQGIAAQHQVAASSPTPEPLELTLIGWQKEINNSSTEKDVNLNFTQAENQFQGDSIALNALRSTKDKRIAALKEAA